MRAERFVTSLSDPGMPEVLRHRLAPSEWSATKLGLWLLLGAATLVLVPSTLWLGRPQWILPVAQRVQGWTWGCDFLLFTALLSVSTRKRPGPSLARAFVLAVLLAVSAVALLLAQPDVAVSRAVALSSAIGLLALGGAPYVVRRRSLALLLGLLAFDGATVGWAARGSTPSNGVERTPAREIFTALHGITVTRAPRVLDSTMVAGGAIEPLDEGFLVLQADGRFWSLAPSQGGFTATRLPLRAPLHRERYLAAFAQERDAPRLRALDFVIDSSAGKRRIVVAHQAWNDTSRCFVVRVSQAELDGAEWSTLFESRPCLDPTQGYDDLETGGRLAWAADGTLLLTVGDHGRSGIDRGPLFAQDPAVSYGKVIGIDRAGGAHIVSMGHRNPQGLLRASDGRIWSSEHGPQGGDEINVIVAGANYGWPLVTYGTQYGLDYWPVGERRRDHGSFVEPAFVFEPSVGVSNLIEVRGDRFPNWTGDLLVGSLRGQTLTRLRTRGDRVAYGEDIDVAIQVRDLAQTRDGRVVIFDGRSDVAIVDRSAGNDGARAYGACAGCHGDDLAGTDRGPSLRHILGSGVASRPGYAFSPALRSVGGNWNEARLDEFLHDPGKFAPGTAMQMPGLADREVRRALIDYLRLNF